MSSSGPSRLAARAASLVAAISGRSSSASCSLPPIKRATLALASSQTSSLGCLLRPRPSWKQRSPPRAPQS
eukprot:5631644-Alexandrium_andersonii.AAC.1